MDLPNVFVKSVSILAGLSLGILLGSTVLQQTQGTPCRMHGPDSSKVRKNVYQTEDGGCCRLVPQAVVGPIIYPPQHS